MKISRHLTAAGPVSAIDLLSMQLPDLPKARLKDAMKKGAVQLLTKPVKRLRRAQYMLKSGDQLSISYDDELLQRSCPAAELLFDEMDYSIWFKPAGMLAQGNEWGDHLSLLRYAEQHSQPPRQVFLLHRLDREASGLVMLGHTKKATAALSKLMVERRITKHYWIRVKGQLSEELQRQGSIRQALDGKACESRFRLLSYDPTTDTTELDVELITGRKHQIRRHFAGVGHPVMGDPQYGKGNKTAAGLALQAISLRFFCPVKRREQAYQLPDALRYGIKSEL